MDLKAQDNYLIASLDRGLEALLEFINQPEMSFSTFMKTSNLNKATAKRVLYTLEKRGFIKYNRYRSVYSLGLRAFEIGTVAAENLPLLRIAPPYMESICKEINETVFLSQKVGCEQIYLHKIEQEGTVKLTLVARRRPLYYGLGKAMLAYVPQEEQSNLLPDIIPSYSMKTISERKEFLEQLSVIRDQGYAIDDEEYISGVIGIGVPIFLRKTKVVGLIGVGAPASRMTCEKRAMVIKYLKKASDTISLKLQDVIEGRDDLVK